MLAEILHPTELDSLPEWTPVHAQERIAEHNCDRYQDAVNALGPDGDMDDFRYRLPEWILLQTDYGLMVAYITHAQGNNGVNPIPVRLEYALVARVVDAGA